MILVHVVLVKNTNSVVVSKIGYHNGTSDYRNGESIEKWVNNKECIEIIVHPEEEKILKKANFKDIINFCFTW